MDNPIFESELRISPTPVCILLWISGMALCLVSDKSSDPVARLRLLHLALLFFAGTAAVWLLYSWRPWAGRWLTIIVLVALVHLGNNWLGMPGFLTLAVIPVTLAAAMIGIWAATATTVAETLLLILMPTTAAVGVDRASIAVTLIATWAVLGVMYVVYHPVYQLNVWLSKSFQRTQSLLEEARDRRAALTQALDDLAHTSRQLALTNERLTALRLIAEEAQKAKAAFAARVSHEFRTPLNMIIGLVSLMVEMPGKYTEEFPPQLWEDLKIVHRNCQHLSSMINDVLDLSQAEAGHLALHMCWKEHCDEVLGEQLDLWQGDTRGRLPTPEPPGL
jgi:signal transduction histidine kinase